MSRWRRGSTNDARPPNRARAVGTRGPLATTVTVVAAHGSARVTQVLPAPAEPDAGESTPVQPQAGESKSVELGADETVAGAATAVTRSHGDPAAPNASDDPDVSAADAAGGEAAPPD